MKQAGIFLILIIFSGMARAQSWIRQDSAAFTWFDLHGIMFLDTNHGWAAGEWGIILKTVDGGVTWADYLGGEEVTMNSACFVDSLHGWSCGDVGRMYRTVNGGITWLWQYMGTSALLSDIIFLDTLRGWVVGEGGTILRTANGGTTWTTQSPGIRNPIYSVDFVDSLYGWASGFQIIWRTVNGGSAWTYQTTPQGTIFWSVDFVDTLHGWVVGYGGQIWTTVDGGIIWTQQTSGTTTNLRSVSFVDVNNGWAVGDDGAIIHTENGGANWALQPSITTVDLLGVTFVDANHGWAVGDSGVILHYHAEQHPLPPTPFDLASPANGAIITSSPVNLSWFRSDNPDGSAPFYDVWMDTLISFSTMWQVESGISDTFLAAAPLFDDHVYYWTVKATDDNTEGTWANDTLCFLWDLESSADDPQPFTVSEFYLAQNYPNPFNPVTTIRFGLPLESFVNISVYNLLGHKITDVLSGRIIAGTHEVAWNGSAFPSGTYLLRLQTYNRTLVRKMLLMK